MSVSFFGYVFDSAKKIWSFPAETSYRLYHDMPMPANVTFEEWMEMEPSPNPFYDERLNVNISQDNGNEILGLFGWTTDTSPVPINQFINLIAAKRRSRIDNESPEMESEISEESDRLTVIFCGRDAGYIENILERLSILAHAFKEYGATHVSWG